MRRTAGMLAVTVSLLTGGCGDAVDGRERLMLGTTHTVEDSGLLDELAAAFDTAQDEHALTTVVAGSGEILMLARRGDLDVLLTHSPDDEAAFMVSGRGALREPVMHNDFVLLGPPADPAGAGAAADVLAALRAIQDDSASFVSRGDDSGTHRRELRLWAEAQRVPGWSSYIVAGGGMAEALRVAAQRGAYTIADRATWSALRDQLPLRVLQTDGERMHNQYSVIAVTDARNEPGARAFAAWLRSPPARELIAGYRTGPDSTQLFTPAGGS